MRKFDIVSVMNGEPICTRDGRPAKIVSLGLGSEPYPITAAIYTENVGKTTHFYTRNGEYSIGIETELDLMIASKDKQEQENDENTQG